MRQSEFERRFAPEWSRFERQLAALEAGKDEGSAAFPEAYRRLCHQLALARRRGYGRALIDRLDALVLRGHAQLYRRRGRIGSAARHFLVAGFPALVREQWPLVAASAALFLLPALALLVLVGQRPELIFTVIEPAMVEQFEAMYDPAAPHLGRERDAGSDLYMFGFYIENNIGVAFRTFAGGLLFGIGSVFFLVHNGLLLGALSAHMANVGFQSTFFSFVVGHGAFELTAIVLAGAAGLRLGMALIDPGPLPRVEALRRAAAVAIRIIYGVIAMLVVAAFIEAFWSSRVAPGPAVKYGVGAALWALVALYFIAAGRRREGGRGA